MHVHKLKRVKLGKNGFEVYKCFEPGCRYYIRKELVVSIITKCWRCGVATSMTPKMAGQTKPHCDECTKLHGNSMAAKGFFAVNYNWDPYEDLKDPLEHFDALTKEL